MVIQGNNKMMHEAMEAAPKAMTHFGASLSFVGGSWLWLGQNYHQIGIIGMVFGCIISYCSFRANKKSNLRKEADNLRHLKTMEHLRRVELGVADE